MPNWTKENYDAFLARRTRLRAIDSQSAQGKPLVRPAPGTQPGGSGAPGRTKIRFTVFAVRPADWDGWHIKELQDCLIHAGLLVGDDWNLLQGEVISCKAKTKAEEKTVIEVIPQ